MRIPLSVPFLVTLFLAGCGGVREINVSAPRPAASPSRDSLAVDARASVGVQIRMDGQGMPTGVRATRFRVTEVLFRRIDGVWLRRLSDRATFVASDAQRSVHPLLDLEIPVARYDSLAVLLDDVYVEFGVNAGGPLSVDVNPVRIPVDLRPDPMRHLTVSLLFDPGAAVRFDSTAVRWHFEPIFAARIDSTAQPEAGPLRQ